MFPENENKIIQLLIKKASKNYFKPHAIFIYILMQYANFKRFNLLSCVICGRIR